MADQENTSGEIEKTPRKANRQNKPKEAAQDLRDPSTLVAVFGSVAAVFQRSPLSGLLAALVMGLGVTGYVAYSDRDVRNALIGLLPPSSAVVLKEQASRVRKDIRKEDEVCNIVDAVGKRISAHRLIYFRYSGESTPTAQNPLPWRFISAVCVYPKPGVEYDIAGAQGMPASLSSELQTVMFPEGKRDGACGRWRIEDIKGAYLRSRFEKNGTDIKVACGQVSAQGLPVASLAADWLNRSAVEESNQEIERTLEEALDTISELQTKPVQ